MDTVNPTAKISASVSGTSITVSASGSTDQGSGLATYYYSKDGGKTFSSSTSNSYTFTSLSEGTYSLVVKVADKSGRTSSNVSLSKTLVLTKRLLGDTVHSGWNLTNFQWEYYDTYWQIKGTPDYARTFTAITSSAYDLTHYNTLYISSWFNWWNSSTYGTSNFNIYICSSTSSCTNIQNVTYNYTEAYQKTKTFSLNISSYTGTKYIKIYVSQTGNIQTNVGSVILYP